MNPELESSSGLVVEQPVEAPKPITTTMALALQLCHLDHQPGFELARLIAAMQPEFCPHTEFWLFFSKKVGDANPSLLPKYKETLAALQAKFKTSIVACRRTGEGYPHGAGDMWFDLINHSFLARRDKSSKADCVLTFESDCLPIGKDWHYRLRDEWRQARDQGKFVCGAYSMCMMAGRDWPHLNGNMVVDAEVIKHLPRLIGCSGSCAWDVFFGDYLLANGQVSKLIHNDYRKPSTTRGEMFAERDGVVPAMIHGVRDDSGRRILEVEYGISAQ